MGIKLAGTIIFILISLLTLYPTFGLNLLGDDWLAFFRYFQHLGPESPGAWNHLTYFLTPYGAQDIMMGFLQLTVGYNSTWYYLTSFFLRIIASASIFPLAHYLTKSRLAAFFAVLFFAVTPIGFDTTNWSSNMTSYITIALFSLFLYFFLKSREPNQTGSFIFAIVLYYLAYVTTPIRMHGSLPFIFLLELYWIVKKRNLGISKKAGIRLALILVVFLIIRYTGHSQGPAEEVSQRFGLGISSMSEMLKAGRFDFLFYPLVMFGSMIIPDFILPSFAIVSKVKIFWSSILPLYLAFAVVAAIILKNITSRLRLFVEINLAAILWTLSAVLIHHYNKSTFSEGRLFILLLISGYALILSGFLIVRFLKQNFFSFAIFLALSWSILSFFFAWWWVPTSIFPTIYRYFIVSALGVSLLLASIISLGKEKKNRISLFVFFCILLILHAVSTRIYINELLNSHSQEISEKIWSKIPMVYEIGKSKEPIIFYFEGDGTNGGILHDVITFGFPPHMAILYNLREEDGGFPIPMSEVKELTSAVLDGASLKAYGYPTQPIPVNRIYAFHLQGKDNLIDITNQVRGKLTQFVLESPKK